MNNRIHYTNLENWKVRRQDKKIEEYWRKQEEDHVLSSYEEYQKEWNFREKDYNSTPSNNGLGLGNPAFVYTTNLVKYLRHKSCVLVGGQCTGIKYED